MKLNTQNAKFDFTDGAPNNFRLATLRAGDFNPVSYTHLTLPTSDLV